MFNISISFHAYIINSAFMNCYDCDGSLPEGLSVAVSGQRPAWAPKGFHSFAGCVQDKDPVTVAPAAQ